MAESACLDLRGRIWHFVRPVPPHLVSVIGKAFIKKSSGTADFKAARACRSPADSGFPC